MERSFQPEDAQSGATTTGRVQLTAGDMALIALRIFAGYQFVFGALIVTSLIGLTLWRGSARLWLDIAEVLPYLAPAIAIVGFMPHLLMLLQFARRPSTDWTVSYDIDPTAIRISDGTGASQIVPWELIIYHEIRTDILFLKLRTGMWRALPMRAFTKASRASVIEIATLASIRRAA